MVKFKQNLSYDIWESTYKWETDNNFEDTVNRIVNYIADEDIELKEKIKDLMLNRKYVPAGRIMSNAGTNLKGTTLINCFVSGFEGNNQDSLDSIYRELHKQAKILKSEGGYGFNVNVLRPRGAYINGIGVESPGAVEFLELWDASSKVVTSGSGLKKKTNKGKNKIRKGAQMVTLDVSHPSIIEFIEVKRTPGKLTKFNMSVLVNDKFMDAVLYDDSWDLKFPDISFEKYDEEWDGDFAKWESKGYPFIVYKTVKASELFDKIMMSNYNYAEPGIIFIDTVNKLNNLNYLETIFSPNPCITGDTVINTNKGKIKVKDIVEMFKKDNDLLIKSFDIENHKVEYKKLLDAKLTRKNAEIIKLETEDGQILKLTPDHKVFTENRGYVKAKDLKDTDVLILED